MIGSIQFHDVMKQRLERMNGNFSSFMSTVDTAMVDVAKDASIQSLEDLNSLMRSRLGHATQDILAVRKSEARAVAVELF
jgi:hypothetical protein